jgi:hypothetical protein
MEYLTVLGISVVVLAICFIGLALNVLTKKGGKFPEIEIGHNKAMRERGITCVKCDEKGECKFDAKIAEFSTNK